MGKYSAVLLPAEEITDPDDAADSKWIPELDDDMSDEFYSSNTEPTKAEPKDKKRKKDKNVTAKKPKAIAAMEADDSEEDETIVMETAD